LQFSFLVSKLDSSIGGDSLASKAKQFEEKSAAKIKVCLIVTGSGACRSTLNGWRQCSIQQEFLVLAKVDSKEEKTRHLLKAVELGRDSLGTGLLIFV